MATFLFSRSQRELVLAILDERKPIEDALQGRRDSEDAALLLLGPSGRWRAAGGMRHGGARCGVIFGHVSYALPSSDELLPGVCPEVLGERLLVVSARF